MPKWTKITETPTAVYFKNERGESMSISCELKDDLLVVYEDELKIYKKKYVIKSTTKKPGIYMSGEY